MLTHEAKLLQLFVLRATVSHHEKHSRPVAM